MAATPKVKTTVEMPIEIYEMMKAAAEKAGLSMSRYLVAAAARHAIAVGLVPAEDAPERAREYARELEQARSS